MATTPAPADELQRKSWWLREVAPVDDVTALRGSRRADICVVGGGYTGLWTALRIKDLDPTAEVVLIESDVCGAGASGRNGGFAMTFWHHFLALERACGTPGALWLARASADAVAELESFCRQHSIDAHYRRDGWLWTATNAAQLGAWERTIAGIERHGDEPFVRVAPEELQARSGSRAHIAGVFEPLSATVQPAALARGLVRVAREQGVEVFERSPMIALERSTTPTVRTPGGRVDADRIVIAMNAWSMRLPELRRALVVVSSWTGPIDRTVDGLPFYHALGRPDLVCGAGYSGNGLAPSMLGGRILASMALGRDDEWARCGLVRPPPRGLPAEPIRYIGGRIVRSAVARKERAEDAGRRPARIDRALARLAPAGLVPLQ